MQECRRRLKVYVSTQVKFLKIDFLKTTGLVEDDIKFSFILTNKYEIKAKNFIIPISFYCNYLVVAPQLFPSLFLFLSSSKPFSRHLKNKKQ